MALGNPIQLTGNVASKMISVIATDGQTLFRVNGGYRINQIAVFRNGVRLTNQTDFLAQDGATVVLSNPTIVSDEILFEIFEDFRVADAIVSYASTQTIYGDLTVNGTLYGIEDIGGDVSIAGSVTATEFYGDGSNLEGVASAGLGTALGDEGPLSVIYYTNDILSVGATITIDTPDTSSVAYTQYADIIISDDADLIVADNDDFIPDILGLSTEGVTPVTGSGGRVRADFFTDHAGTGAPTFQTGLNVLGDVSIGGTLTYQDVTNVDAIGIITANNGINVTSGGVTVSGVVTATSFEGSGANLSNLNIPVGFNELDAMLFL